MEPTPRTYFAPAERKSDEDIRKELQVLGDQLDPLFFEYFPLPLVLLNSCRQIVFCTQPLLDVLGLDNPGPVLGKRPGEALGCIYSRKCPGGCGTSKNCRQCGAVLAILEAMESNLESCYECQLLRNDNGEVQAMDLRVIVRPLGLKNENFYLMTVMDIADEKRRQILERVFYHDLLNTAGGAKGLLDLAYEDSPETIQVPLGHARTALADMMEEILKQQQLLSIERGDYIANPMTLQGLEILQAMANQYSAHPTCGGKTIRIHESSENLTVIADYTLLRRVLGNMLKNALEATPKGGVVRIGLERKDASARFWVHNITSMPEAVQLQVFKRSFSTKGKGRGIGTYSIKLLTEKHMGGQVGFSSNVEEGTTFWISIPLG